MSGYRKRKLNQISEFSGLVDSKNKNRISVFQISMTNRVSDHEIVLELLSSENELGFRVTIIFYLHLVLSLTSIYLIYSTINYQVI